MTHKAEQGREQWTAARVGHHLPMWLWPQIPFSSDRVGLGIGLGDLPTWRLQVPMTFSRFPLPCLTAQLQLLLDVQDAR